MKHFPPQRQVISCVVTFPHVQHQIDSKRAKKSGFFSREGMNGAQVFRSLNS